MRALRAHDIGVLVASGEALVEGLRAPAKAGTMRFVVQDLAPGRYALSAFHDENDNGELDTNLLGIPSEGYGFGNDASAAFVPLRELRKGQASIFAIQGGIVGEARIVERAFGVGPCALTEAMALLQDHLASADS